MDPHAPDRRVLLRRSAPSLLYKPQGVDVSVRRTTAQRRDANLGTVVESQPSRVLVPSDARRVGRRALGGCLLLDVGMGARADETLRHTTSHEFASRFAHLYATHGSESRR
jgi:hypothetical protein